MVYFSSSSCIHCNKYFHLGFFPKVSFCCVYMSLFQDINAFLQWCSAMSVECHFMVSFDFLSINNIWPIHKVLYQYKLTNNYKNYILILIYLLSASAASSVRPPKRTWHWKNKIIIISRVITLHKYLNLLKTFCCVIMGVLFIEVHVICKQWNLRS